MISLKVSLTLRRGAIRHRKGESSILPFEEFGDEDEVGEEEE